MNFKLTENICSTSFIVHASKNSEISPVRMGLPTKNDQNYRREWVAFHKISTHGLIFHIYTLNQHCNTLKISNAVLNRNIKHKHPKNITDDNVIGEQ